MNRPVGKLHNPSIHLNDMVLSLPLPAMIVGSAATCIGEAFTNPQSARPFSMFGWPFTREANGASPSVSTSVVRSVSLEYSDVGMFVESAGNRKNGRTSRADRGDGSANSLDGAGVRDGRTRI